MLHADSELCWRSSNCHEIYPGAIGQLYGILRRVKEGNVNSLPISPVSFFWANCFSFSYTRPEELQLPQLQKLLIPFFNTTSGSLGTHLRPFLLKSVWLWSRNYLFYLPLCLLTVKNTACLSSLSCPQMLVLP